MADAYLPRQINANPVFYYAYMIKYRTRSMIENIEEERGMYLA